MVLVLYAICIFVSAALLFMVQPLVARMVLPVLGGSPAVWNTAMVFFQAVLLAGYLYAHLLTRRFGQRAQVIIHAVVLLLPALALTLPIALPDWAPPSTSFPVGWMLLVLLVAAGLPFFVVSTTGPLLQRWFSRTQHASAKDPYFLYAASNTGSLLALLGYPFVIEPLLGLSSQSAVWAVGYGLFAVLGIVCGVAMLRLPAPLEAAEPAPDADAPESITWRRRLLWILLAFVPSSLMLGVTQHVSTDIAAAPLLWVIPLSIYLLTFILAFARRATVPQASAGKLYPIVACAVAIAFLLHARQPGMLIIAMHMMLLLIGGLLCHKRLADDRPDASHLTEFYLLIALGGVLGGTFNALVAPLAFTQLYEYPIVIVLAAFLIPSRAAVSSRPGLQHALDVALPIGILVLIVGLGSVVSASTGASEVDRTVTLVLDLIRYGIPVLICFLVSKRPARFALVLAVLLLYSFLNAGPDVRVVRRDRTFFGAYRVIENTPANAPASFELTHGTTSHGSQMVDPPLVYQPTGYYARTGPVGQAMEVIQGRGTDQRAALVGLGVGTIAAYARDGDSFTYYEIDPVIVEIAQDRRFFSYLRNAENTGATIEFVIGDARLTMADAEDGSFDYVILDAFSSDAIPVHLLTTEAIELFMSKVAEGGIILLHVSNQHLNLEPVVASIVDALGLQAVIRWDTRAGIPDHPIRHSPSTWVVIARDDAPLAPLIAMPAEPDAGFWRPLERRPGLRPWTDDHANILGALNWD